MVRLIIFNEKIWNCMRKVKFISFLLMIALFMQIQLLSQVNNTVPEFRGKWQGELSLPNKKLVLIFNIAKNPDGKYSVTMDVPEQGAKDILSDKVITYLDSIEIKYSILRAEFIGKLQKDSSAIVGEWRQAGNTFPLTLQKNDKEFVIKREQDPAPPYTYNEEDVTIKNEKANITLAGTLTYPKSGSKFPAVVLITGSGKQDRNEEIFGHRPFLVIADYLTKLGIAVLRVDDRGAGKSTGNFSTSTTADFATDVEAEVNYLKTRKEINAQKIGLLGHSEGGIIAPMVANADKDIAFLVLLAAPGLSGDKILIKQTEDLGKIAGTDSSILAASIAFNKRVYHFIKTEKDSASAFNKLLDGYLKYYESVGQKNINKDDIVTQVKALQTNWLKYFLTYNPEPALTKIKCPVLALNGEKDLQVSAKENLPIIKKALTGAGNKNFKVLEVPGVNHLFQTAGTGSPSEYAGIKETFSPEVLDIIGNWLKDAVSK
jgi:pimeloyl-ACP methyl ester carboxylesterase